MGLITWWNCGSGLKGKIDSMKYHFNKLKPRIMFISEADFQLEDSGLLEVDGYDLIQPMQTSNDAQQIRVAAYISSSQAFSTLAMKNGTVIGIQLDGKKVFGYYRTHRKTHQSLQRDLALVLDDLTCRCNEKVILGGDFNIDNNKIHDQDYHHRGLAITLYRAGWLTMD